MDSDLEETGNKNSQSLRHTSQYNYNNTPNQNSEEDVSNALIMYEVRASDDNYTRECNCESTVLIVDDNMFNLIPLELILKELF